MAQTGTEKKKKKLLSVKTPIFYINNMLWSETTVELDEIVTE
jgi:hypothetical protein